MGSWQFFLLYEDNDGLHNDYGLNLKPLYEHAKPYNAIFGKEL